MEVNTRPPAGNGSPTSDANPVEELARLMGEVAGDDAYRRDVEAIGEELRAALPPESRALLGTDPASFAAAMEDAVRDWIAEVAARLRGGEG